MDVDPYDNNDVGSESLEPLSSSEVISDRLNKLKKIPHESKVPVTIHHLPKLGNFSPTSKNDKMDVPKK